MPRPLSEWTSLYMMDVLSSQPPKTTSKNHSLLLELIPAEILAVILITVAYGDCNALLSFVLSSKLAWSFAAEHVSTYLFKHTLCTSAENAHAAAAELRMLLAANRLLASGTVQDFDSSMTRLYQKICLSTGFRGVVDDRFLTCEAFFWASQNRPIVIKKRLVAKASTQATFHVLDMQPRETSTFEPLQSNSHARKTNIITDHLSSVIGFDEDHISLVRVDDDDDEDGSRFVVAGSFALFSIVKIHSNGDVAEETHVATFARAIRPYSICALRASSVITACIVENAQSHAMVAFHWEGGQRSALIKSIEPTSSYFLIHAIFIVDGNFVEWGVQHKALGSHIATFVSRSLTLDTVTGEVIAGDTTSHALEIPNTPRFKGFECVHRTHPRNINAKPHYALGKVTFPLPLILQHDSSSTATAQEKKHFKLFSSTKHLLCQVDVTSSQSARMNDVPIQVLEDGNSSIFEITMTPTGRLGAISTSNGTFFFDFEGAIITKTIHHSRIQPRLSFGNQRFAIQTHDTVFCFSKFISKF